MSKKPIGVFDSGIGGTSILKELVKLLPNEDFIYVADSANAPYGEKNPSDIIRLCKEKVDYLLQKECKLIVVACNTATTNAIKELRSTYAIPFIGIEPAIKPAALNTKTNVIGILATKGTLNSALFSKKVDLYSNTIKIIEVVGKGLVESLEAGDFNSANLKELLSGYLNKMVKHKIDYLVLGCSHYPYLIPLIKEMLPHNVRIIDSGEAVAKQTKRVLIADNKLNIENTKGRLLFLTNAKKDVLLNICRNYFTNYIVERF